MMNRENKEFFDESSEELRKQVMGNVIESDIKTQGYEKEIEMVEKLNLGNNEGGEKFDGLNNTKVAEIGPLMSKLNKSAEIVKGNKKGYRTDSEEVVKEAQKNLIEHFDINSAKQEIPTGKKKKSILR